MQALERWGWDAAWAERFARHGGGGGVPGRVSAEHRGQYHFHGPDGEGVAQVSGRFRHHACGRSDFPAVGDWVTVRGSPDAGPAVIEAVLPRNNKLSRQAAGESGEEQILAANLDVLFLVTSLNRDLNPRRVERFLAAAALPGCRAAVL
ncbi:MAG: GTPase RsgA, partial [Gemmataceae bacterium]